MCNVHFILTLIPPWLQVKVAKYFDFGNLDVWRVAVCVRFSSETTRPISPMMIPINWGNSVDVQRLQHVLYFDFDPSMTAGQGHEILWFWEFRCLTGSSLCSLLLRNYSTDFSNDDTNQLREQCRCATCDFSNDDTNQLREQCRCATCTSFWPWPPPWLQVKAAKYFDFGNLDVWRVAVCVRFFSETTQPISPMMIPINWGNNVDVQRALHFDLDPSKTAGQGHKILRFCEFRFLTGSSLCLLLLRNYLTKFSNADASTEGTM